MVVDLTLLRRFFECLMYLNLYDQGDLRVLKNCIPNLWSMLQTFSSKTEANISMIGATGNVRLAQRLENRMGGGSRLRSMICGTELKHGII
jgi:hypothetical protein